MKKNKFYFKNAIILLLAVGFVACANDDDPAPQVMGEASPYISVVYDFLPAVGQFTNLLPEYKLGDTHQIMVKKAEEMIKGEKPKGMISLGGFGGYVVFGFDHTIENKAGYRDFRILGNTFWATANPNPNASTRGGNSEPGLILVSHDANANGLPDDAWYQIAGSEYNKLAKDYKVTYHKPNPNKQPVLDDGMPYATDVEYIYWEDNQGGTGYKFQNKYQTQSYFPEWITDNTITFEGTLLPPNGVDESGNGNFWVQYSFGYGYADNAPNSDDESAIDINWAVDREGNKVHLPGINFIKVYSGVNQQCGWIGETSTEVAGAYDLHLLNIAIKTR